MNFVFHKIMSSLVYKVHAQVLLFIIIVGIFRMFFVRPLGRPPVSELRKSLSQTFRESAALWSLTGFEPASFSFLLLLY
tara:strand:+ start:566 stop:802 length:237 start_codon:yes stop_codon:yes gene_type:complete